MHPTIKRLLPRTGIEATPFRNSASKVAGLQVHATTPGDDLQLQFFVSTDPALFKLNCLIEV